MYAISRIFSMLMLVVVAAPLVLAAPSSDFKDAMASYKNKRYGEALNLLLKLPAKEANEPLVHYYKGLTYQALRQYDKAQQEYMWNYRQKADKSLSYKSWQALEGMKSIKNTSWSSSDTNNFDDKPVGKTAEAKGWSNAGYEGEKEVDPGWGWQRTSAGCGRH